MVVFFFFTNHFIGSLKQSIVKKLSTETSYEEVTNSTLLYLKGIIIEKKQLNNNVLKNLPLRTLVYIPVNSSMNGKTEWLQFIVAVNMPYKVWTLQ